MGSVVLSSFAGKRVVIGAFIVLGLGACSNSDPNANSRKNTLVSLNVEPGDVSLEIQNDTSVTQVYTVTGTYQDGHTADLTNTVDLSVDPSSLGAFAGSMFTSNATNGGVAEVIAKLGEVVGKAKISIKYNKVLLNTADGTLPADPASLFGGTVSAARKPIIVYPVDKVILPPNLGVVEIHWRKGNAANTLFEVSFANSISNIKAYTRCKLKQSTLADGCVWSLDPAAWSAIANTNRGAEPVTVSIRATDNTGTAVGQSDLQTLEFTRDAINGGVYYWSIDTSMIGASGVKRFDFGVPGKKPESAIPKDVPIHDPNSDTPQCIGCHVVSRTGNRLAARNFSYGDGYLLYDFLKPAAVVNEGTGPLKPSIPGSGSTSSMMYGSFSPDGTQLVATRNNSAKLHFYKTDCDIATPDACINPFTQLTLTDVYAMHPAWSPDGQRIAMTAGVPSSSGIAKGRIVYTEWDGSAWSDTKEWVAAADGLSRGAPGFAPDSSFVVYTESSCAVKNGDSDPGTYDGCDLYVDISSKIWAAAKGSTTPIALDNLNAGGPLDSTPYLMNTFARFAPFASRYKVGSDEQIFWVTIGSRRKPGLGQPAPGVDAAYHNNAYLWMAAVRPSELSAGRDPSVPAFVLPFQDFAHTSNIMAEWTEQIAAPIAQ